MNKRVWSIAVALAMLLSMVCSVFVVSAADESVSEGNALDATVQLNNYASEPTSVLMDTEKDYLSPDEEFDVSVSLKNYKGDWAIFVAELTYDPAELEYNGFETKISEEFTLSVDDSNKASGSLTVFMMSNQGANLPAVEGTAALMDLKFKAIAETASADLSFTLEDDSVAGYVGDEPEFIASADYIATSVFERVVRVNQPYLTMRLVDENGNPVTEIEQGGRVKAIVHLNNFYEGWMMMTLDLQYNGNKFKYISSEDLGNLIDPETDDPASMLVAETEDPAKPLSICFFSPSLNNMILKDGASDADILELTLEAQGAGSALQIGASFQQNGNFKYDAEADEEELLTPEDYVEEHEEGTAEVEVKQTVLPYLSVETDKTVFSRGDTFTLKVNINNYVDAWSMMSILVNLDPSIFEVATDSIIAFDGSAVFVPVISGNKLGITMFSEEGDDLKLGGSSGTVLEIPINIKSDYTADGSEFPITVSFLEGGNLSGDDVAVYEETPAEKTITVGGKPELSIRIDQINGVDVSEDEEIVLSRGDTFTLKVNIDDYINPWSMMSILVNLETDVYDVDTDNITAFGGSSSVAVVPVISGDKLGITMFSEEGDDLDLGGSSGTVLEIPITVKDNYTADGSEFPITVSFLEGGNLSGDDVAVYEETPAEKNITVRGKPELSIRIDQIDGVEVSEDEEIGSIEQGKEVRFAVSIKDFTNAWEVMTLKAKFDSAVFEFVSAEDLDAFNDDAEGAHSEFITESAAGTLLACWFNGDPLPMYSSNQDIMVFTLKVKQKDLTKEQLSQFVSVEFLDGGNYADGVELDGDSYTDTPAEVEVTIKEVASEISVKIEWGAMEFTYSFGTWDPQNHIWDGRGWSCVNEEGEAENWITVTNQGEVDITASFAFAVNAEKTDLVGLTHSFEQDGTAVSSLTVDKAEGDAYNSETVQFELGDLPEGAKLSTDTKTVLGTITVTIDKADSE